MEVKLKKLRPNAQIPTYGSAYAAGADLYACLEEAIPIPPGESRMIPTGLAIQLPEGYAGLVYARSGLASRQGLAPSNKVGVIDADYRGEITVSIYNQSKETRLVSHGDRIAQLVLAACPQAEFFLTDTLDDTLRGTGGFGSTGK